MAQLTITIPDDKAQAILDAFCKYYGYNQAGGQTKLQFLKTHTINYVKSAYLREQSYELQRTQDLALKDISDNLGIN